MSRRAACLALALLALVCVLYGSIVPLHWHEGVSWDDAITRLGMVPFEPTRSLWTGDFFVNVLVFLPIGFFACGAVAPESRRVALSAVAPVSLFCIGVAALVEFSQLFVQDRTPSWSDVFALSLGGLAGSLLWAVAGQKTTNWLASTLTTSQDRRVFWLLAIYSAGWLIVGLLPLLFPPFAYPLVRSVWLGPAEPDLTSALADAVVTALAIAPIGAFLALFARTSSRAWPGGVVAAAGAVVAVLLGGLWQVTPFLTPPKPGARVAGMLVGASLAWYGRWPIAGFQPQRRARWPWVVLMVWCLVLVLYAWAPFDFGVSPEMLDRRVEVLYVRVPLHRYYWVPPLTALNMALTVFLLALPLGGLLRLISWRGEWLTPRVCVLISTTLFGVLEWGQLYLPGRRADPTDVLIAAIGAVIGVAVARDVVESPPRLRADS
jgi:VanZ family protein